MYTSLFTPARIDKDKAKVEPMLHNLVYTPKCTSKFSVISENL